MNDYVFISYSSKDDSFVRKIVKLLNDMHVEYWKAPEKIPPGSSYAKEINRAIEKCSLFLLLFSDNSQNSIWVEKELDCALSYRKVIIPYNIDGTVLNDAFKFYLNNVQMIFHTPSIPDSINELMRNIKPFAGKDAVEIPVVKEPEGKALVGKASSVPDNKEKKPEGNVNATGFKTRMIQDPQNPLSLNRIPVYCKECGGPVHKVLDGIFRCVNCGTDNYDDFREIHNFIREKGPRSALQLEKELGIPRKIINSWSMRNK